jgi:transposase
MRVKDGAHWAGVDWGQRVHDVCVLDTDGELLEERRFDNSSKGLGELSAFLSGFADVQVAIETPRGPVVEALLDRDLAVFAINPKQLDRFRDRFYPSGAKDDRRDAFVLAHSRKTDAHAFKAVSAEHPVIVELREWSRMHRELSEERVRLTNRLQAQLRRYYPQLDGFDVPLWSAWILDLFMAAPTPDRARSLRRQTLVRVLRGNRMRKWTLEEVREALRAPGFTVSAGTVAAASAHAETLVERIRVVSAQHQRAVKRLDELTERYRLDALTERYGATELGEVDSDEDSSEQHDVDILRSLPGVGKLVLAVLLAEALEPLQRRDYHGLRALSGVAPVTRRSGRKLVVLRRHACHQRLAWAVFQWARAAMSNDPEWHARYAALRARGHTHGRALRTLGDRLLRIACAMLEQGAMYDADRLAPLQRAA